HSLEIILCLHIVIHISTVSINTEYVDTPTIGNGITNGVALIVGTCCPGRETAKRTPHIGKRKEFTSQLPVDIGTQRKVFIDGEIILQTAGMLRQYTSEINGI